MTGCMLPWARAVGRNRIERSDCATMRARMRFGLLVPADPHHRADRAGACRSRRQAAEAASRTRSNPPPSVSAITPATSPVERKAVARRSRFSVRASGGFQSVEEALVGQIAAVARGDRGAAEAEAEERVVGAVEVDQEERGEERPARPRWMPLARTVAHRDGSSANSHRGLCWFRVSYRPRSRLA